jgi:cob(I)alamin adenosyltransferase
MEASMTIAISRVYTRTGDRGETGLVGGKRVPKDSPRIRAYGTIDELNAVVGLVRTFNEERLAAGEHHRWLDEVLRGLQNELFDLGSELATPPDGEYEGMFKIGEAQVTALERLMDGCQKDLAPLKSFTPPAAAASTRSCTWRAPCAGAPSASCSRPRARSPSASGRSST